MEAIGTVHVRLCPPGSTSKQDAHLVDVNVILEKATMFIVLALHDGSWPLMIENRSGYDVSIGQVVSDLPCQSSRDRRVNEPA